MSGSHGHKKDEKSVAKKYTLYYIVTFSNSAFSKILNCLDQKSLLNLKHVNKEYNKASHVSYTMKWQILQKLMCFLLHKDIVGKNNFPDEKAIRSITNIDTIFKKDGYSETNLEYVNEKHDSLLKTINQPLEKFLDNVFNMLFIVREIYHPSELKFSPGGALGPLERYTEAWTERIVSFDKNAANVLFFNKEKQAIEYLLGLRLIGFKKLTSLNKIHQLLKLNIAVEKNDESTVADILSTAESHFLNQMEPGTNILERDLKNSFAKSVELKKNKIALMLLDAGLVIQEGDIPQNEDFIFNHLIQHLIMSTSQQKQIQWHDLTVKHIALIPLFKERLLKAIQSLDPNQRSIILSKVIEEKASTISKIFMTPRGSWSVSSSRGVLKEIHIAYEDAKKTTVNSNRPF